MKYLFKYNVYTLILSFPYVLIASDEMKINIIDQIKLHHARIEKDLKHFKGSIDERIITQQKNTDPQKKDTEIMTHRRIDYFLNGDLMKFDICMIPDNDARSFIVFNTKYGFAADQEPKSKLYLSSYQKDLSKENKLNERLNYYLSTICAGEYILDFKLTELLSNSIYDVTEVKEINYNNYTYMRIDLKRKSNIGVRSAWAILNYKHEWEVVESGYETDFGPQTCKIEYQDDIKDVPFPKQITRVLVSKKGNEIFRREYKFTKPEKCNASEKEITMSAFGLPEIGSRGSTGSRMWLWLSIIGILCFVIAVFIRIRYQAAQ